MERRNQSFNRPRAASKRFKIQRLTKSVSRSALGFVEYYNFFERLVGFCRVEPVLLFLLLRFIPQIGTGGKVETKEMSLIRTMQC